MDPQTGRVLAAASYPDYDPQLFVGGISAEELRGAHRPGANDPLVSRAIAGQYAPGSTFKLITTSSLVTHHEIAIDDTYPCPGSVAIDGRVKTNYDSESFGAPISLRDALGYSCDTFFYVPAAAEYYADQNRIARGQEAARVPAADGVRLRRRDGAGHRPARRRAGQRLATPTARPAWPAGRRTGRRTAPRPGAGTRTCTTPPTAAT